MLKLQRIVVFLLSSICIFPRSKPGHARAQDLSGLSICVDPGHGNGNMNQGPTGLREADINLTVSVFLREFLSSANTDTVLLTRVDDSTNPTLSQRESLANSFPVDWFHSVHHNACGPAPCNARHTLMLVEEVRTFVNPCPNGRARGTGEPEWPGQADVMSDLMGARILQALRTSSTSTWLDWSFYGGCNGGFSLGVLNDLFMPGELSEATFHQNLEEENKLRNDDFLKLEARALCMAFLDFYDAGTLSTGALAGIIQSQDPAVALNGAGVLLNPPDHFYTTDDNNNGVYVFHDVPPGTYNLSVTAVGFVSQEKTVTVDAHDFGFCDFTLSIATGDVNADGTLTPDDALCAFRIFLNGQAVPSACDSETFDFEWSSADANCDGKVTPGDALAIFQRFLDGLPPEYCFALE